MTRTLALSLALLALCVPAAAQEVESEIPDGFEAPMADSDNPAPLPGTPTVSLAMPADPNDLLTGLYATRALAEICDIAISPEIGAAMSADEARFMATLSLPPEGAGEAYAHIRSLIEARAPDCAPDGPEVTGVSAVLAVYAEAGAEAGTPAQ